MAKKTKSIGLAGRDPERSAAMIGNKNASKSSKPDVKQQAKTFYETMIVTGKAKPFKFYKLK